ncbi:MULTISPECIES: glycosyltransferase [unclassified Isoptericola]|uniref:glycosyltransferase n=1 Tax=unclassified Isoptericola TaxID=2623355 RepID=UPI00366640CC
MTVEVLLATYNSERYLGPLLESLAAQTYRDFRLVVSDDVSTDRTLELVDAWAGRFAHPPRVLRRSVPSGGAAANFAALLAGSRADHVLLADHDDVWLPDKVEAGLARVRALEREHGADVPVLVHGDLEVIDGDGRPVAPSFWAFKSIRPEYGSRLRTALMHPTVTGCTAVLNRSLVERVGRIPPAAVMHDWWIGLVAAAFGVVDHDPEPRIRYRIHGGNVSAPKRSSLVGALRRLPAPADVRRWVGLRVDQGELFLETYRDDLPAASRRALEELVSVRRTGPVARRRTIVRGGFVSPDLWRTAATLAFI